MIWGREETGQPARHQKSGAVALGSASATEVWLLGRWPRHRQSAVVAGGACGRTAFGAAGAELGGLTG